MFHICAQTSSYLVFTLDHKCPVTVSDQAKSLPVKNLNFSGNCLMQSITDCYLQPCLAYTRPCSEADLQLYYRLDFKHPLRYPDLLFSRNSTTMLAQFRLKKIVNGNSFQIVEPGKSVSLKY